MATTLPGALTPSPAAPLPASTAPLVQLGPPEPASRIWVNCFGFYLILLNVILFYLLFRLWPGIVPVPDTVPGQVTIIPFYFHLQLWPETRYLCLVAIAGALGGYIHLSTSFVDYLGNRRFYSSWKWWYGLRPFIGSSLALIVYFAARGGLVAGTNGASTLSPYGIAAMAGLAGLFSKQATDKLREVFDTLFKPTAPTKRAEPLDGTSHS